MLATKCDLINGKSNAGLQAEAASQDSQQLGAQRFIVARSAARGATGPMHVHRELGQAPRGLRQLTQAVAGGNLEDFQEGEDSNYCHLKKDSWFTDNVNSAMNVVL
jgi:hypothetical protein